MVVKSIIFNERKRLFLKYLWHRNYLFSKERWELAGVPLFLCRYNTTTITILIFVVVSWNFKWKKSLSGVLWIFDPNNKCCARTFLCLLLPHCVLFQSKYFIINVMLLFITNYQASKQSNHHHITWNKTKNYCFKRSQKISISKMNKTSVLYVSLRPLTPELSRHLHTKLFVSRKGIFANRCRC